MQLTIDNLKRLIESYYMEIEADSFVHNLKRNANSQQEFDIKLKKRIEVAQHNMQESLIFIDELSRLGGQYWINEERFLKKILTLEKAKSFKINQKRLDNARMRVEWARKHGRDL